ncbi:MAG: ABC transporter permease subunit [Dehalococcoidia bacterium]
MTKTPTTTVVRRARRQQRAQGSVARWTQTGSGRWVAGLLLLLAVGLPAIVPVFYVVVNSFSDASLGQAFTPSLAPWERAFDSPKTLSAMLNSFILTIRVPIGLAIAFIVAWLLIRVDVPGRRFIMYSLWFVFFLPILPMTLGWMLLANRDYGLMNELLIQWGIAQEPVFNIESIAGMLWIHLTLATIPIMTLLLAPALQHLDASFEEASDMAGAKLTTTLRRITLPLVLPAALTALIAGLIKSLEVFEVEQILGAREGIFVYSTRIFNLLRIIPPDYPQAMALSTLFLVILLVVAVIYQKAIHRYQGNATITGRSVKVQPRARTWWAWAVSLGLFSTISLTVGVPFVVLLLGSFNRLFGFFFLDDPWTFEHWVTVFTAPAFATALRNSIAIGLLVATLGTLLYAALAAVLTRTRLWSNDAVGLLTWLPWAIPGVLLGTAFLNIFLNTPIIRGVLATIVPLVVVLIVQSLPLGTHMMRSSVEQISSELEEASHMAGAGRFTTFRRITLPLVAPMFVSVFVLVFMTAARDIGATVLLATPGTRTLPLLMFEFASSANQEAAAVIGVITAVFALLMTVVAFRLGARFSIEG